MITFLTLLVFICFIAWLSHKEITKSLRRARKSEYRLENERNTLELRVAERTEELIAAEAERISRLEHSAQFGKISQGLFHDLMSPLSSLSLYIELATKKEMKSGEYNEMIQKMTKVSRDMNSFMESLRQYIGREQAISENILKTDLVNEIIIVKDILGYKARMAQTKILLDLPKSLIVDANRIRIHQLIINLTSNAIEACEIEKKTENSENIVCIKLDRDGENATLSVSDTGIGVPPENMKKIFINPFTTKIDGTGTGLMTIKSVVEKDLHGHISVQNNVGGGTIFKIVFPYKL